MTQINALSKTIRSGHFPAVLYHYVLPKCYSTSNESEIIIPKRIQRSPTDILRALSKTVNRDPTAPHFKYHDDPYLIPASNYAKRSYALAQESGRKAAKWILQEHADLFNHRVADPFIEAFAPKQIITEESDVDIEQLNKAISNFAVADAITIYQILEKKNIELSKDQLQSLLELICFYNAEDKLDEEWIEERWFKQVVSDRPHQRKTWQDGGVAESIFLRIDPPDSKSFSTLITGMGMYGQLENAWNYYDEAKSKGVKLHPNAYNVLITNTGFVREQHDARWTLIKELLGEMNSNKVKPNLGTLNAVLAALSYMQTQNSKSYALQTIAEFRKLGIEPSLASYYFLLRLYSKDRTKKSAILVDIINALDGKTFTIKDPKDVLFFVTAMEVCNSQLSDVNLADRINDLLLLGDNYNLIGDSYKESVYLRNYFMLKCENEPIETYMEFYELYVPNVYVPEPVVMEATLKAVDMNGASQYLSRLWSDMILFDHITKENLVTLIVEALYRNPASEDTLANKMADTAESIFEKIEEQNDDAAGAISKTVVGWTGRMLGQIMAVLLHANRFDKACLMLSKLDREQQKILGVPDIRPLTMFVEKSIERKDPISAVWCIQYCYDAGYEETQKLAENVYTNLKLTENQLSRLKTLANLE